MVNSGLLSTDVPSPLSRPCPVPLDELSLLAGDLLNSACQRHRDLLPLRRPLQRRSPVPHTLADALAACESIYVNCGHPCAANRPSSISRR